jgi:pSer/pThr/pTyr-binding forkhead associated (FHA) protein
MAKLVLLSAGMTGRTHELKVDRTTVGRLEDNTFQVPDPSVSSHHCEILLRGGEIVVRDLDSTNGTSISGNKVTEAPLKPGQILRLGQIEMRLETEATAPAPAAATTKKLEQTMVMQRGVSLNELVEKGTKAGGFDTTGSGFSKKKDSGNQIFWIIAAVFGIILVSGILWLFLKAGR